jgi:hypothetical protein
MILSTGDYPKADSWPLWDLERCSLLYYLASIIQRLPPAMLFAVALPL